jgi:hypothetical protein
LNSRIALRATAEGGKSCAFVLDFNLLPRLAPPKKSMEESDLNSLERSPSRRQWIPPNANAHWHYTVNREPIARRGFRPPSISSQPIPLYPD